MKLLKNFCDDLQQYYIFKSMETDFENDHYGFKIVFHKNFKELNDLLDQ